VESFGRALAFDSENEDAALPLAQHYFDLDNHAEAYPLLYMLSKRAARREQEEQHRLALMLGQSALASATPKRRSRPTTRPTPSTRRTCPRSPAWRRRYYAAADWEKAFKFYQMLLVHAPRLPRARGDHRHLLSLGCGQARAEREAQGAQHVRQGAGGRQLPPAHARGRHRLYEEQQKWDQVIHYKKQILEVSTSDDERFNLNVEIGDLWNDKQKNPGKAIESYKEATYLKPEDHPVLHKLLAAYQRTKQWEEAIDIIEQISAADKRDVARAKFSYTVAVIRRDELKDVDGAIDKFNEALDPTRRS
jgi:tetratricopeptide (TPR) repeat protein